MLHIVLIHLKQTELKCQISHKCQRSIASYSQSHKKQTNKQKIKPVQSPMSPLNFLALSHGIAPYSWRSLSSPLTCLPHQTVATEPGTSQAISCTSFPCNCKEGTYREVGLWSFSPLWRRDSRDPEQGVIFLSFSVGKKSSLEVPSGATLGLPELPF